jgi:hypothetical protein
MTARHSKVIPKKRKMYSEKELITRRFHKDVRQFKALCDKHGVPYSTFDTAEQEDVCVLSKTNIICMKRENLLLKTMRIIS